MEKMIEVGSIALCFLLLAGNAMAGPLHDAVDRGDLEAVRGLLQKGADVNETTVDLDRFGRTALMLAAEEGHAEIARLLMEHKANVNATDYYGRTALMWAAIGGHADVTRSLLEHKAAVNVKDNYGLTALMSVAVKGFYEGAERKVPSWLPVPGLGRVAAGNTWHSVDRGKEDPDVVKLLVKYGAEVNAKDKDGMTAVIFAAGNNPALVRLLLELGATLTAKDSTIALTMAASSGSADAARLLIERGADLNAKDKDGLTALMRAADRRSTDTIRLLLEHGADINAKDKNGATALMRVLPWGYEETARLLIERGADVNVKDNNGGTALMTAAYATEYNKGTNAVKLLIEKKADVNAKDGDGATALIKAATSGHMAAARLLLEHGADANAKDNKGNTALSEVVSSYHMAVVRLLIQHGVNGLNEYGATLLISMADYGDQEGVRILLKKGFDVNAKDNEGGTALIRAAYRGHLGVVRILLQKGAEVNAQDNKGETALMAATSGNHPEVARLLREHGADVPAKESEGRTEVRAADSEKIPKTADLRKGASQPLHEAVQRRDLEAVRSLLKNGADVNAKDVDGRTPLILAISEDSGLADGVSPVEKLLMEYKADVNAKDNNGRTALMTASLKFNVGMVKYLIKQNADLNARDNKGLTALMETAFGGKAGVKIDLMELLVRHKADINIKDTEGETALMKAAFEGYLDAVRGLIGHKADVNAKDNNGETALMKAAVHDYPEHIAAATLLVEHGADVNAKDSNGRTSLMFAVKEGTADIAKLLVTHKADVNAKDNEGMTVLMWAADGGRPAIVLFLLEQKGDLRAKDNKGRTARAIAEAKGLAYLVKMFQDAEASENLDVAVVPEAILKDDLLQVKQREDGCAATFALLPLTKYRQWHQSAYRASDGGERFNRTAWIELKRRPELLDELRAAKLAGLGRLTTYAKLFDQDAPPAKWARDRQWIVEGELADLARFKKELAGLDERALAALSTEQWRRRMSKQRIAFIESGNGVLSPELNWMGAQRTTGEFCKNDVRDADAAELLGSAPVQNSFEEAVVRELSLGEIVRLSKLVHEVKMKSDFVKSFNVLSAPRVEFDEKTKCATAVEVERKRFSAKINWGQTGEESAPFERKRVTRAEWHAFLRRLEIVR